MPNEVINLAHKLSLFHDTWSPRVVAEMNDYQIKLAKLEGEFVWHSHEYTDETFLVLNGTLHIELPGGEVILQAGELYVVARGVEHRPWAEAECQVLLIEPRGVINTGKDLGERTAEPNVWI